MKLMKGKVVSGKVVVEGDPLDEGAVVTVILAEDDEAFRLGAEGERVILDSISEAERGETISGEELLGELDRRG